MRTRTKYMALAIIAWIIITVFLSLLTGCADGLRFAPTESQKQTAALTADLATRAWIEGLGPRSDAGEKLASGANAAAIFFGPPQQRPDAAEFDTLAAAAQSDAAKRPDANDVMGAVGQGLSLAAQLAILFGVGGASFGSKKLVDWIALLRRKADGFGHVVEGNELLKDYLKVNHKTTELEAFAEFHRLAQKGRTPELVAVQRLPIKRRRVVIPKPGSDALDAAMKKLDDALQNTPAGDA